MGDNSNTNYTDHMPMLVDTEDPTQGTLNLTDDRNIYYQDQHDGLEYLVDVLELVTPKHARNEGLAPIPEMDLPPSARGRDYLRPDLPPYPADPSCSANTGSMRTVTTATSSPMPRGPVDLSAISRSPLHLPLDVQEFTLSPQLQHDLSVGRGRSGRRARHNKAEVEALLRRVFEETETFARKKKEAVREALKERQDEYADRLSSSEKKQLRNRREAKVTRVKDQAAEAAVRSALKWMIANAEIRHPEDCPCRGRGAVTLE